VQMKTVHLDRKEHKCEGCGKCFGEKGKPSMHMKTIHLKRKNKCEECGKYFERKEIFLCR
jgi:TPP-dependent indolepyruvate ferredoxin oxidoreductase alpha subunit